MSTQLDWLSMRFSVCTQTALIRLAEDRGDDRHGYHVVDMTSLFSTPGSMFMGFELKYNHLKPGGRIHHSS